MGWCDCPLASSSLTQANQAKKFFALSDNVKQTANRPPGSGPNRGYAAVGKEKLAGISGYSKGVRNPKLVQDVKVSNEISPELEQTR